MATKKHITLTKADVRKLKHDIIKEATEKAFIVLLTALMDEYGFKAKRLQKVWERADRYCDYIEDNLVNIRQVQKILEDKTGVKLKGF